MKFPTHDNQQQQS